MQIRRGQCLIAGMETVNPTTRPLKALRMACLNAYAFWGIQGIQTQRFILLMNSRSAWKLFQAHFRISG